MADVRLTATNPEDSSVVPVACNEKGELKLEEPIVSPPFDGNLNGDLNVQGEGNFAYTVTRSGRHNISSFVSRQNDSNTFGAHYVAYNANSENPCFAVAHDGSATFAGAISAPTSQIEIAYVLTRLFCGPTGDAARRAVYLSEAGAQMKRGGFYDEPLLLPFGTSGALGRNLEVFGGLQINTEPDNDANYTVTTDVDEEGNTVENRVYNGPTLDVKEEILLIKAALQDVMEKLRMVPPNGWEVWDGSNGNS